MPTSTRACICPPAEAAAPVRAARRSTAPRRRRRRPCRGGAPPPAPGPRRRRLDGPSCVAAPARARAAPPRGAPRAGTVLKAQVDQACRWRPVLPANSIRARNRAPTPAPRRRARNLPKIARRSSWPRRHFWTKGARHGETSRRTFRNIYRRRAAGARSARPASWPTHMLLMDQCRVGWVATANAKKACPHHGTVSDPGGCSPDS